MMQRPAALNPAGIAPCRKCGGTDAETTQKPRPFGIPKRYRVSCPCGHDGPLAPTGERARALWNAEARRN